MSDPQWKSLAVKAAAGLAALVVAGFAAYKLTRSSAATENEQVEESKSEAAAGGAKGGKLTDVKDVMAKFAAAHPTQDSGQEGNACEFYNSIDPQTYDEFLTYINFCDPGHIAEAISKPEPTDVDASNPNAKGFGYLNTRRDAEIFDIGQGTGLMGKLLSREGFSKIDGADASSDFVQVSNESGWYRSS